MVASGNLQQLMAAKEALKAKAKSSRSRSKQARMDDMLKKAAEHARKSMPGNSVPRSEFAEAPRAHEDAPQAAPRGRKRGALQ